MTELDVVLPNDIDDPAKPSGGNVYDRRVCRGLTAAGWSVHEHPVVGEWPYPSALQQAAVGQVLAARPDGAVVLLDGLVASGVPEILTSESNRLRLAVLLHMPLGNGGVDLAAEKRALSVMAAVVTTSRWSRQRLLDDYGLAADRVHVAQPGADVAPLAPGSPAGKRLLCVAAVAPHKGHDRLVAALAAIRDLPWTCVCVGSVDRDRGFVQRLRGQIQEYGLTGRIDLAGARTGADLEASYAAADLLVLASRGETYGMVVTEALAHGVPVLATAVDGLPEAVGQAADGSRPGLLVPPDDPAALAGVLRAWLTNAHLRRELRRSARGRRDTLTGWATTSQQLADVLLGISTTVSVRR